jgi:hypothetical protein
MTRNIRGDSTPFSRAIAYHGAMMAAVAIGALNSLPDFLTQNGEYRSRGHGGKHRAKRNRPVMRGTGTYITPHQGAKECARRSRGPHPESVPVREWKVIAPNVIHDESWAFVSAARAGALRSARHFGYAGLPAVLTSEVRNG